jgi:hypothetical protein
MNSVGGETMNSNPKYQHMGINDVSEVKTVFSPSFYPMLFDDPRKSLLHFHATTVLLHISLSSAEGWTQSGTLLKCLLGHHLQSKRNGKLVFHLEN